VSALEVEYVVVQAGGKGTRLGHLTSNKPKALTAVENLPMIFHLFRKFPEKRYVIISDYKKEVLREYLRCFAEVKYQIVEASGGGTCGGIKQALELLPAEKALMLLWSDLILPENFEMPRKSANYLGISETFGCRWSYINSAFEETASSENGVAGLFIFKNKNEIADIPESGELVAWLKEKAPEFETIGLAGTKEYGVLAEYEKLPREKCRPFNKITIENNTLIKEAIDGQGEKLAKLESKWYGEARKLGVKNIPQIYALQPLKMELISGKNIYEYDLQYAEKREILRKLTNSLKELHKIISIPADSFSVKEAYCDKTLNRLGKIRDLVPFSDRKTITVNGRECRNVYFYKYELEKRLAEIKCGEFVFIHGDCTFSNLMLRNDTEPVFIDPRGYFGFTELYGDANYDWAKLYYSIAGNYDRFNLKDFRLTIGENAVELNISSNKWEDLEADFFELSGAERETIKLLHAVIWLSLTTYAWPDYDSVCGAFYNGIYYLEEVFNETF
jgi:GTP:adenosylcobinamide-phosphate guanylyltransferase/aminoglycoside phosphotransferase